MMLMIHLFQFAAGFLGVFSMNVDSRHIEIRMTVTKFQRNPVHLLDDLEVRGNLGDHGATDLGEAASFEFREKILFRFRRPESGDIVFLRSIGVNVRINDLSFISEHVTPFLICQ